MSGPSNAIQWYLARNGRQYGPLTDAEIQKIVELGHLKPDDLVWREGFPDWRPAVLVFSRRPDQRMGMPTTGAPVARGAAAGQQPATAKVQQPRSDQDDYEEEDHDARPRRWPRRVAALLFFAASLGAAGWYAYPYRDIVVALVYKAMPKETPSRPQPTVKTATAPERPSTEVSPFKGFDGAPEAVDGNLQRTPLWRIVKKEFPDWYAARLKEGEELRKANTDDAGIAQYMAKSLVVLRRQNADAALQASVPRLKTMASTFVDNLARLKSLSVDACYGLISQGESSPVVVGLLRDPKHTAYLQNQLISVFEAIADGRKTPQPHEQPKKADYDVLATELKARGWTTADLTLFSDEKALAQAPPAKVCGMVEDWFRAQLSIKDPEVQTRLLVDALRPVVAG